MFANERELEKEASRYREVAHPRAFDAPAFEDVDVDLVCKFIRALDTEEALLLVRWIDGEHSVSELQRIDIELKSIVGRWIEFKLEYGPGK